MKDNRFYDKSATYQIRVEGILDLKWSDWFDGFSIEYVEGDTTLTGLVSDQPALYGLLAKIRDLGLTLLQVELIEPLDPEFDGKH